MATGAEDDAKGSGRGSEEEPEDASDAEPTRAEKEPGPPKSGGRPETTIIVPAEPALSLHIQLDEGEPVLIAKERFIIGRGPSCDLMVKSARVSREHAAVVREGAEYFIEDLNSSNGTWFDDARITRRLVADGEEYLLGGIRVTFTLG
ncbi:FHA domain-containing protein [Pyxidicoccus fallax]|uniref:FHA domain-containing protein n=3 Tax=Pyxidicoccus fallax TaxID=394095 RepID=A0A848LBK9_9BACT|nr:FHA domain-containing protein [Pyxidicoccus fallax]